MGMLSILANRNGIRPGKIHGREFTDYRPDENFWKGQLHFRHMPKKLVIADNKNQTSMGRSTLHFNHAVT